MTARGLGRGVARLSRALDASTAKARAAEFAHRLKAEYEAGKAEVAAEAAADPTAEPANDAADAEEVAEAIRGVDWAKVRATTSERGAEAAQAMKSMAAEVDWGKVQPVAAKVSSALIAAVASGHLGIGGKAGSTVARAIMNDRDLAQRVSSALSRQNAPLPPDFRGQMGQRVIDAAPIDTTATE
ncbi:MAG: hypothetical protein Q8M22_12930 [Actinomycetota bacterium]|nr:hypothetical protein [Actinomycetota bacterium]